MRGRSFLLGCPYSIPYIFCLKSNILLRLSSLPFCIISTGVAVRVLWSEHNKEVLIHHVSLIALLYILSSSHLCNSTVSAAEYHNRTHHQTTTNSTKPPPTPPHHHQTPTNFSFSQLALLIGCVVQIVPCPVRLPEDWGHSPRTPQLFR